MEEIIDLQKIYQILKKRLALIVVITFIATVASGIVSYFFITPTYQVSTELFVNNSREDEAPDVNRSMQFISTYSDILRSPAILDIVAEELELDVTGSQLRGQITVSNSSQIITLTVQGADPNLIRDIANTTATVFQREIGNIMNIDNVSILAEAETPRGPVSPNPKLNMAIALLAGLMSGIGLTFLLEYLDKTVKSERDIENLLDLPVVASISRITEEDMKGSLKKAYHS